ncbi:energy transducer TonB [Bdellovibrio bacteriovorus]|uniref:energy transducer TonB n=1 Tax=Bdellovibrio bacteriovorus TaxID=959 RepID=UPI0035A67131
MGFSFDNDKSNNGDNQLSLFDFQMAKADFVQTPAKKEVSDEGSSAIDFNAFLMAHREPEQSKTSRFMTMSAAVHAAALLAIAVMTVPLVEQAKTETITIEIEDVAPPKKMARGVRVPPTQGGTPAKLETPIVEKMEEAGSPDDIVVAKPKAAAKAAMATKASPAKSKATAKAAKISDKVASSAKPAARSIAPKTTFKAVPMTIDDIEAPELDEGELANTTVQSHLSEDFNEDFEHIDQSQKAKVENERRSMDAMAAALAAEQDENLASLDEANKEEADRLASAQDSLRKKNANAIASALAAERAAALAAARQAAAREEAAKKAGLGGNGNGYGTKQGNGAGNNGSQGPGTQVAGSPSGVRSLDQLRQMPGNPRPHYDREERRRGDQGEIGFVAYVTKDGYLTKFKMTKSTGFRNLDAKTLAALKKWRFYPGQEGWVELPFRWDLKGGIQEDGGRLRISSRQ